MNKTKQHHANHLSDAQFAELVFGDESSQELNPLANHVETCQLCQHQLSTFVASDAESHETIELLKSVSDESDLETPKQPSLDFLSEPTHPELLGRLGRYDIESVIGAGGMGVVLKAFDTELNRPVAIKVLASHLARSGAARKRFAREARAVAAVVHDHVVAIHNVETDSEVPFLVMQFVKGESLQSRVDRKGPLETKELLRIATQAAAGLAAAHQHGIVHRDVKPANILLGDNVERVYLSDFGLARTVDDASLTQTGIVTGTPHYMSPEQANGGLVDAQSDLFSLGSVMYFMATGHPPFRADRAMGVLHRICSDKHRPAWQVNGDIPFEVSDLIDRLLHKQPSKRLPTAGALSEHVTNLLKKTYRPSRTRLQTWRRTLAGRMTLIISCVAMLCLVGLLGWAGLGWSGDRSGRKQSTQEINPMAGDTHQAAVSTQESIPIWLTGTEAGTVQSLDDQSSELLKDVNAATYELDNYQFLGSEVEVWANEIKQLNGRLDRLSEAPSIP